MSNPRQEQALRTDHLQHDITHRSVRGGTVTAIAQAVKMVLQFGTVALLARLLAPETFGLIAMVAAVLMFLEYFKDLGLSSATVQREIITHGEVSTLFWLNVALGIAACLLTMALAPALAWFYGQPKLLPVTLCLSVGFLIGGLGTQQLAILRRQMRFGALAGIQLAAECAGMLTAIAGALLGAGYWALVLQRLAYALVLTLGGWSLCGWLPGRIGRIAEIRGLIGFGGNITASNIVNFMTRSLDEVLIGWYWGPLSLGLYERSSKLLLVPINNLNFPLYTVMVPTLSRLAGEPDRYRRVYWRALETLAMVTMPAAAVLVALPETVVSLLFGPHWLDAAPIVRWLGVAALYQPVTYTCSWLFISQNRTGEMLRWGLISSGLVAASIAGAVPFGPTAVAASFSLVGLVIRLPLLFWMVGRRGPIRTMDLYQALLPSAGTALLILVASFSLTRLGAIGPLPPVELLSLATGLAIAIAAACFLSVPQSRRILLELAQFRRFWQRREVRP